MRIALPVSPPVVPMADNKKGRPSHVCCWIVLSEVLEVHAKSFAKASCCVNREMSYVTVLLHSPASRSSELHELLERERSGSAMTTGFGPMWLLPLLFD